MFDPNVISNRKKFEQKILFEGIYRIRGVRPTDIDASWDYGGRLFIFCEVKEYGRDFDGGQTSHLYSLAKMVRAGGGRALVLMCWHTFSDDEDVYLKDCKVVRTLYPKYKGKILLSEWVDQCGDNTVIEWVGYIENYWITKEKKYL
jgi:hypothetical protein